LYFKKLQAKSPAVLLILLFFRTANGGQRGILFLDMQAFIWYIISLVQAEGDAKPTVFLRAKKLVRVYLDIRILLCKV
jgi:hypothetical protein